jgi:hypothetical protein
MRLQILDLDGALTAQPALNDRGASATHCLNEWGPRIRLGCGHRAFRRFKDDLNRRLGPPTEPALTFCGSGDFHHVSLGLIRRIPEPFNLLVIDKHPDWMRGVPMMHCGTWVCHAVRLPTVQRVYHIGGDLDFDNAYRWLAPWPELQAGKIKVIPAIRRFEKGRWRGIPHQPLRARADECATRDRVLGLIQANLGQLARYPLYISLDKDVMTRADAVVNWDSGFLQWAEVETILDVFLSAAQGRLAGMDVVGDWSAVRVHGLFRKALDRIEHPSLAVRANEAVAINERLNLRLIDFLAARGLAPRSDISICA